MKRLYPTGEDWAKARGAGIRGQGSGARGQRLAADALDHNIPLRNPFGRNLINKKGQAAGNKKFGSLDDAVDDWENHIVAAPYVQGLPAVHRPLRSEERRVGTEC